MSRNPVRHTGINTGLHRPNDRVLKPKRMQPQRGAAVSDDWDEPHAELVTADGDFIQQLASSLPDTTGFTCVCRVRLTQDTLSSYFFLPANSAGPRQLLLGRINGTSGNKVSMILIDDSANLRNVVTETPFRAADGFKTLMWIGDRATDILQIWLDDEKIYDGQWIDDGWSGSSQLDFTTNASPVQEIYVGRESTSSTRSDMDLRRIIYWNSRIIDPDSEAARRTIYDATGEIVSTVPGSPHVDVQGSYGALWNNVAGSLGNFGLQGTVTYDDQSNKRLLVGNDTTTYGYTQTYGDLAAKWLDDQFNGIDIDQLIFRDSNNEVRIVMDGAVQQPGVTTINVTLPSDYAGVEPQPMALVWDAATKYDLTVNQDVIDYIASKEGEYITLVVDPV